MSNSQYYLPLITFVILLFERLLFTLYTKEPKGKILDGILFRVAALGYLTILWVGLIDFIINKQLNYLFYWTGLGVYCLGMMLRRISVATLSGNWSVYTRDIHKHEYIQAGIYKYFRHPYYLSVVFELLGISILFQSLFSFLLICFIQFPLIIMRVFIEKKLHQMKFFNNT